MFENINKRIKNIGIRGQIDTSDELEVIEEVIKMKQY